MERDVEMDLSLWEMFLAVKRHWMIALVTAVLCATLGGVFGYIRVNRALQIGDATAVDRSSGQDKTATERAKDHQEYLQTLYENTAAINDETDEINRIYTSRLAKEWQRLKKLSEEHPMAKVDPDKCEVDRLTVAFAPEAGIQADMIYDWIQGADESKLFGEENEEFSLYKDDLISVDVMNSSDKFSSSTIRLYAVDGFDTEKAASYLKIYLKDKARSEGVEINAFSDSHKSGHNDKVYDFQNSLSERMNTIRQILNDTYVGANSAAALEAPAVAVSQGTGMDGGGISLSSLLKYVLVGFALGIFAGMALAIFITIRQGCLLSCRQIEEDFGLELLSNCSKNVPLSLDVLNANLDVIVGEKSKVMLIGSQIDENVAELTSQWSKENSREFVAGRDITEDSETIDALSSVEGILLGVKIGESKLSEIQRILIRAKRLNKRVLGYILV